MKPCASSGLRYLVCWSILLLGTKTFPLPAAAQEKSVKPGINQPYVHPDLEKTVERFEREGREVFERRNEILAACGLKPGMDVADVGAGTGLFTRLFAPEVRPGKVYAVDISTDFIEHIKKTCGEAKLENVTAVVCPEDSVALPDASVDLVFVCDTYHHFEYPQKTLASIRRGLRPGGRLVVVDYRKEKGVTPDWVFSHVRLNQQETQDEIRSAGFEPIGEPILFPGQYLLQFRRSP